MLPAVIRLVLAACTSHAAAPARGPADVESFHLDDPSIGGARQAFAHFPEGEGPFPVVIAFHGGHGNTGAKMVPHFDELFDEDVILLFPSGNRTNPGEIGWVGPGVPGATDELQDVRFVQRLIREVGEYRAIDRSRVYAVGFSNGAYMTHTLYCLANEEFAGFMMVSRTLAHPLVDRCAGGRPKKVLLLWGTADDKIENDHSQTMAETMAFYEQRLGCIGRQSTVLPDTGDDTTVTRNTWGACAAGGALEVFEIGGGGHFWPGPDGRAQPGRSRDVDATRELARFFGL